jgi:glycosyltransferase involved in cell wall biosynthesis
VLLHPARPWDLRPVDADDPEPPAPDEWPAVGVVIPARNEADSIGPTLGALDQQDYPGGLSIVVVDERSSDITGDVAREMARVMSHPCTVITGEPLPDGWAGKVWGMDQGIRCHDAAGNPDWLLLTEALEALQEGPFGPETPAREIDARRERVEELDAESRRRLSDAAKTFQELPLARRHDLIEDIGNREAFEKVGPTDHGWAQ